MQFGIRENWKIEVFKDKRGGSSLKPMINETEYNLNEPIAGILCDWRTKRKSIGLCFFNSQNNLVYFNVPVDMIFLS